jgi:hypothetical protein
MTGIGDGADAGTNRYILGLRRRWERISYLRLVDAVYSGGTLNTQSVFVPYDTYEPNQLLLSPETRIVQILVGLSKNFVDVGAECSSFLASRRS